MKPKNIFKYLMIAFSAILLSACTNDSTDAEKIFDKTPTDRINEQKTELNNALLSSEFGWKAVYFTDDTQLGGYTHLFKFSDGGKVQMASDFDYDTAIYESDYSIALGSTVSLVFDTFNRIHLLSDSDNFPTAALRGKGYLGDFQFLYYGQENGDILFKSNRLVREVRFVKATAEDWADLPKNLITEQNVIEPLFRLLEINDGTTIKKYDFSFSPITRLATCTAIDDSGEVITMGVGYTPTSIVVSPAVVIAGQKLTNFVYNDTDGSFTATGTAGVTASIKISNTPLILTDDYKILLNAYVIYGHDRSILYNAYTNSALFITLFENAEAALPAGMRMIRVQPYFNTPSGSYIEYRLRNSTTGVITRIYHFFTLTSDPQKGTITLNSTTSWKSGTTFGNAVPIAPPASLKDLDDQLTNPAGLYFMRENFTVGETNTVFTFTGVSAPFRMTTWAFQ